jgi:hypothetical protein
MQRDFDPLSHLLISCFISGADLMNEIMRILAYRHFGSRAH